MLIPTHTALSIPCSTCGQGDVYRLSLFLFSSRRTLSVVCNCGAHLFSIKKYRPRWFRLNLTCPLCAKLHVYPLTRRQIWQRTVLPLACPVTHRTVALLGPEMQVRAGGLEKNRATAWEENLSKPLSVTLTPQHNRILDQLKDLLGQKRIFCACEQMDIEVAILPDQVHLHCATCQAETSLEVPSTQEKETRLGLNSLQLVLDRNVPPMQGRGGPRPIHNKYNA